jgi:hypothetical protein
MVKQISRQKDKQTEVSRWFIWKMTKRINETYVTKTEKRNRNKSWSKIQKEWQKTKRQTDKVRESLDYHLNDHILLRKKPPSRLLSIMWSRNLIIDIWGWIKLYHWSFKLIKGDTNRKTDRQKLKRQTERKKDWW